MRYHETEAVVQYGIILTQRRETPIMKSIMAIMLSGLLIAMSAGSTADPDDRQDRRQERGRADERQDRRDCRRDEGIAGEDKRECKQEEVRDGVRGKQGERVDNDDDDD
jgi:hypothetical protein